MRTIVIVVCFAFAAGCLRVDVGNGVLKCSSDPSRPCPEGYFCAGNNTCWQDGSAAPVLGRLGETCQGGKDCGTGHCVDGVCCDSSCSGQCQACDVGGGVCTTITGAPHGFRPGCGGTFSVCAGVCDGQNANACTFPGSSKPCGAQACFGPPATLKAATVCDGAGQCVPVSGMLMMPCPAPTGGTATCAGDQCDFVCNPPYVRQGSTCVAGDMG